MKYLYVLEKNNCPLCDLFSSNSLLPLSKLLEKFSIELKIHTITQNRASKASFGQISSIDVADTIPKWCTEYYTKSFPIILYKEDGSSPVHFTGSPLDTPALSSWITGLSTPKEESTVFINIPRHCRLSTLPINLI